MTSTANFSGFSRPTIVLACHSEAPEEEAIDPNELSRVIAVIESQIQNCDSKILTGFLAECLLRLKSLVPLD
jgi:hypothetical protein